MSLLLSRLPQIARHVVWSYPYRTAAALLLTVFVVPFCLRHQSDFSQVYLLASQRIAVGADIYPASDGYPYPPLFAWVMQPLTWLPPTGSRIAWYLANVLAVAVLFRGAWRLSGGGRLEGPEPVPLREHLILGLGLLAGVYYTFDALTNQQTDLIVAAFMMAGCVCLQAARGMRAATLFGIAGGLKCAPLLWGPYLGWRGRPLLGAWVIAVAVTVNFVPDLTSSPPEGGTWMANWVTRYIVPLAGPSHDPGVWGSAINFNHSLSGVINRFLTGTWNWEGSDFHTGVRPDRVSTADLKLAVSGIELLMLVAACAVLGWRDRSPSEVPTETNSGRLGLEYSLVLILMLMLSPMSSKPHFCTLILPGWCLARMALERRDWRSAICLGMAIAAGLLSNKDLCGNTVYTVAIWYGSVTWNAVLLYLGCALALPRLRAQHAESVLISQAEVPRLAA